MIIMDGKALAEKQTGELKVQFAKLPRQVSLAIISIGDNPVSSRFIKLKKTLADKLNVRVVERVFADNISGAKARARIADLAHDKKIDGIIIQLPLPKKFNTQDILNAVPPAKDVDMLSSRVTGDFITGKTKLMSPVVGAISDLAVAYNIDFFDKRIVVAGSGRLVGQPVAMWLMRQGIGFTLITENTKSPEYIISSADVIITGVGKKIIDGGMVKDGVIIFDAGTSETGGKITGDIDFDSVSKKALAITPVPGGIGPLTAVWIFKNLFRIIKS